MYINKLKDLKKSFRKDQSLQKELCDEILKEIARIKTTNDNTIKCIIQDSIKVHSTLTKSNERDEVINKLKSIIK